MVSMTRKGIEKENGTSLLWRSLRVSYLKTQRKDLVTQGTHTTGPGFWPLRGRHRCSCLIRSLDGLGGWSFFSLVLFKASSSVGYLLSLSLFTSNGLFGRSIRWIPLVKKWLVALKSQSSVRIGRDSNGYWPNCAFFASSLADILSVIEGKAKKFLTRP